MLPSVSYSSPNLPASSSISSAHSIFLQHPLYLVTGEEWSLGRTDEEIVHAGLRAGIRIIQLRDKKSSAREKFVKAQKLLSLTKAYGALLIINDDPDLALAVGADGVHLGQGDMPIAEARRLAAGQNPKNNPSQKFFIGLSTHNQREVATALNAVREEKPDYINLGPLFSTNTKKNQYPPIVGDDLLENPEKQMAQLKELQYLIEMIDTHNKKLTASEEPMLFSVMGGIKSRHLNTLNKIGVRTFAMITEITSYPQIELQIQSLTSQIEPNFNKIF